MHFSLIRIVILGIILPITFIRPKGPVMPVLTFSKYRISHFDFEDCYSSFKSLGKIKHPMRGTYRLPDLIFFSLEKVS